MVWTWDDRKAETNKRIHGLSFELAQQVFDDPLALSRLDRDTEEERWQTVGTVAGLIVFVVHTWAEQDASNETSGRIISARKATRHERKAYEEGEF